VAELAATAGVEPWPWTVRELAAAARAKALATWDCVAALRMDLLAGKTKRRLRFDELHPLRNRGRGEAKMSKEQSHAVLDSFFPGPSPERRGD
jgi:hypothetical protein